MNRFFIALLCVGLSLSQAQARTLVTGKLVSSYMEQGSLVVELDAANTCGSSKYVSETGPRQAGRANRALRSVRFAARSPDMVTTIAYSECAGSMAIIENIISGPDV